MMELPLLVIFEIREQRGDGKTLVDTVVDFDEDYGYTYSSFLKHCMRYGLKHFIYGDEGGV